MVIAQAVARKQPLFARSQLLLYRGLVPAMDSVYLRYPDGQMTQRTESQVRSLWNEGLIPGEAIYWKEGMSGWGRVEEWLGKRPAGSESPPDPLDTRQLGYRFTVEPTKLTKLLQNLLWIGVAVALLASFFDLSQFLQVQRGQVSLDQLNREDSSSLLIGLLQSGLTLATGVTFLKWVYRAYKNIRGFGAEGLRFSPGWAIGYYFIPILGLVRPVQVMSEIWRASEDPYHWAKKGRSWLVRAWWTLFLLYSLATQIGFQIAIMAATKEQWLFAAGFAITADLVSIPLSIVTLKLVTNIYQRQKNLVDHGLVRPF